MPVPGRLRVPGEDAGRVGVLGGVGGPGGFAVGRDGDPPLVEGAQRIRVAQNASLRADLLRERDGDDATLSNDLNNAAQYRSESGDFEGALADFDTALVYYERSSRTDHPEYATCLENRGGVLYRLGRVDETFAALEQVRDIRRRNLGPDHIDVVRTGLNMGAVASIAGDYEKALAIFRELEPVLIEARGHDHQDVMAVLRNEGSALRKLGRNEEAQDVYAEAVAIAERLLGEDHPKTARARGDYGIALYWTGDLAEAERQMVMSFDVYLAELGAEHPSTVQGAENLVALYEKMGQPGKAEPYRAYVGEPE